MTVPRDPAECPRCADANGFDLDAEISRGNSFYRAADKETAKGQAYITDLSHAGHLFAHLKTWCELLTAKAVIRLRADGERSFEAAKAAALAADDAVYRSHLEYRVAEQRITRDREALRLVEAKLDDLRTQAADARAADSYHASDRRAV